MPDTLLEDRNRLDLLEVVERFERGIFLKYP
jgi:hypothetical protein